MSTQSNLLKRLRISVLMVSVLTLVTFAYSGGGAATADSMSDKWLSPAASAARKNPIPPTQWSYNNAIKDDLYDPAAAKKPGKKR